MRCILCSTLSLPVTRWADDSMWPLDVTLAFNVACCVPASEPLSIFIRQISQTPGGELCRSSLLCNLSRLRCDTCQRGRKWRSDSLNYLTGKPVPLSRSLPSVPLAAWDQSITQSVFPQRCSGRSPHQGESDGSWDKVAIWRRDSWFREIERWLSGEDRDEGRNCGVTVSSTLT